jgi:hypothetical protein
MSETKYLINDSKTKICIVRYEYYDRSKQDVLNIDAEVIDITNNTVTKYDDTEYFVYKESENWTEIDQIK